jgi:outer membrane receptor protein involved in Fe transport
VVKPQSPGVLGVKQFYNTDYITSRGFEFGYKTPERYRLGGDIIAAYTRAVIPTVTKYITQGTEVVDAVEITDDALPEIPPFETTMNIYYRMLKGKLIPRFTLRVVARQDHVAEAFYEQSTPGFCVLNLSALFNISHNIELNAGVTNVLDRSYYEHLNRRIIGSDINLHEPGRVFFATLFINI